MAGAALFEAATFLKSSDRIEEVRHFVDGLDGDSKEAYHALTKIGLHGKGKFAMQLKHARDYSNHYAELLPQAEDHEKLKQAMQAHAETRSEIRDQGAAITGFRAVFADEVAVELIAPDHAVDVREFVRNISEHIALFLKFAFAALPSYIESLPAGVWEYITAD